MFYFARLFAALLQSRNDVRCASSDCVKINSDVTTLRSAVPRVNGACASRGRTTLKPSSSSSPSWHKKPTHTCWKNDDDDDDGGGYRFVCQQWRQWRSQRLYLGASNCPPLPLPHTRLVATVAPSCHPLPASPAFALLLECGRGVVTNSPLNSAHSLINHFEASSMASHGVFMNGAGSAWSCGLMGISIEGTSACCHKVGHRLFARVCVCVACYCM